MKRVLLRTGALVGLIAMGWVAIAQAQRSLKQPARPADDAPQVRALALQPTALAPIENEALDATANQLPIELPADGQGIDLQATATSEVAGGEVGSDNIEPEFASIDSSGGAEVGLPADATSTDVVAPATAAGLENSATDFSGPAGAPQNFADAPQAGEFEAPPAARPATSTPPDQLAQAPADDPFGDEPAPRRAPARRGSGGSGGDRRGNGNGPIPDPAFTPASATEAIEPTPDPNAVAPRRSDAEFHSAEAAPYDRLAAVPASENLGPQGTGVPGEQELEGPQAPTLTVEKTAPPEVQVGCQAAVQITVHNEGQVAAHDVEVLDMVPKGARLLDTNPRAEVAADGQIVWRLGSLPPGEDAVVEMQIVPEAEGELGSVATVRFATHASVRTTVTQPVLAVEVNAPPKVMRGEEVQLRIRVTNTGTGAAQNVLLHDELPEGLEHPAGRTLQYEVGTLAPNETHELELKLISREPGHYLNQIAVRAEGNVEATGQQEFDVVAPALEVGMTGPKRRYLEREATYTFSVSNPGTAAASNIELITSLPKGLKFIEANNYGEYDAQTRAVRWMLEELPPGQTGEVTMRAMPIEAGEQKLYIQGRNDQGLSAAYEQVVLVEGVAAVLFEVVDVDDPIEVGADATYEIRVINQGTKLASNVRLAALMPEALEAIDAEGPARRTLEAGRVIFDPLARLEPKGEVTYRIKAKGLTAGDARIKVQLLFDDLRTPITKEESTRIYADE